ncbi:MAG TPA: class I SAM-dependent methyltransferase [Candidatus Acidoferrum sp.]|nr:class I SAM-dependent methyltransferase [Candidatus Acidoferrum sp.]
MRVVEAIHGSYVHRRRVRVLTDHLASVLPRNAKVLDVGCGDGELAALLAAKRNDVSVSGIDVLQRAHTAIPVKSFDGASIPYPDRSFDVVLFVDVLHHTIDPTVLLREAKRVARHAIVIKDHDLTGALAHTTLRFMDRVGNGRHGVALPYNYWTPAQWHEAVRELGLTATLWKKDLALYPVPACWLFDRSLHFIAVLSVPTQ